MKTGGTNKTCQPGTVAAMMNINSILTLLLCTTTGVAQGLTLGPYEAATSRDSESEEDSDESDESDDNETINHGVRYLWPILFSVFAALIFGVVYTCTKKNKCAPRGSGNDQSPGGSAAENTNTGGMHFTNSAFGGNGSDILSDFPGSSFGEGIEMVPPPYCEKPPDYDDIFQDREQTTSETTVDRLPEYSPPGVGQLTPVETPVNYTPIGFDLDRLDPPGLDMNMAATPTTNVTQGSPETAASPEHTESAAL